MHPSRLDRPALVISNLLCPPAVAGIGMLLAAAIQPTPQRWEYGRGLHRARHWYSATCLIRDAQSGSGFRSRRDPAARAAHSLHHRSGWCNRRGPVISIMLTRLHCSCDSPLPIPR